MQHATCLKQRCWKNVSGKRDSGFEAISGWPTKAFEGPPEGGGGGRGWLSGPTGSGCWGCCCGREGVSEGGGNGGLASLHHSNDKHCTAAGTLPRVERWKRWKNGALWALESHITAVPITWHTNDGAAKRTPDDGVQQLCGLSRGNQSDTCKRQRDEKRARQMSFRGAVLGGVRGQGFTPRRT